MRTQTHTTPKGLGDTVHDISLASSYYVKYRVWACMCVCVCTFSPGEDVLVQEQACFSLEMKYLPDNSIFTGAQPARQGNNTHPQIHKYLHTHIYLWAHTLKSHIPQKSLGREKIAVCGKVNHSAEEKNAIRHKVTYTCIAERTQKFVEKVWFFFKEKGALQGNQYYTFCRENCRLWQI